jgi:two-component sensor histidine kinase
MYKILKLTSKSILLLLCLQLYSQTGNQVNVDSLLAVRKAGKLSPEGKVKLYEQLYVDNFYSNIAKALKYNDSLFMISKKNNLKTGLGLYYQNVSFNKYLELNFLAALQYCKKANKVFIEDKNYNCYLFSIARQCMYLEALERYDEAFQLANRTIKVFEKKSKPAGLGEVYLYVAEYYSIRKKYNSAMIYVKLALEVFQKEKYYHGIAECDIFIGTIHKFLEKYSDAIKYFNYLNDLPTELRRRDSYIIAYLMNMAEIYRELKNNTKTIQFANKAITLLQKKSDLALYVIEMQLYKADSFQKLNRNENAMLLVSKVEKEITKFSSDPEVIKSLTLINEIKSNIYSANKQYNLALATLQKNLKYDGIEAETYKNISTLQYKMKLYKEAFESQRIYQEIKFSQLDQNQKNNLNELQVLYDVKDKDFKIQNLKIRKLKNELELKEQKVFSRSLISIAIILLIVLGFAYYIFRIRNKVSQILKYKNKKLEDSNTNLIKSLKEKEILLKEIHHRVKNNLQLVSSILFNQANETPDISALEFFELCQNRISSIALIHQNLYLTENIDSVDFQVYLKELAKTILDGFSKKDNITFEINTGNTRFNIQTAICLGLIITELSSNSIKHAFKDKDNGIIYLDINHLGDKKFELIFGDNGCGNQANTKSANSIGLELVELLVMQLCGEISKLDRESVFYKIIFEEIED